MAFILPSIHDLPRLITVRELADRVYEGLTYDTALPQPWVDRYVHEFDVRGKVVWGYGKGFNAFGYPFPLTKEAADFLREKVGEQAEEFWNAYAK